MFSKDTLSKDFFASFVVFLIAMPLCLGISIACGVDPIKGILTGIIGGVVVGLFSGSPLQISGPSAGLAVMVLSVVSTYGAQALVPLGIVVGVFQLLISLFKISHFFQATPSALLKGMLSGIGALIAVAQTYILFNLPLTSNGLQNFLGIPKIFTAFFTGQLNSVQLHSSLVGLIVIVILILWKKGNANVFKLIPGPLVSTIVASILVFVFSWDMKMVMIPEGAVSSIFSFDIITAFQSVPFNFYLYSVGFAFIATVETLLCVSAVDKMAKTTSHYDKQMFAQAIGNIVAGIFGAIPIIGVIVRSAANVEFGGKTKLSSILHGVWIALFLLIPGVLELIPVPALAGLLIYTGFRLLNIQALISYLKAKDSNTLVFLTTFLLTITVDLLVGVIAGFALSLILLMVKSQQQKLGFKSFTVTNGPGLLELSGRLSFIDLPKLTKVLHEVEQSENLKIDLTMKTYIDRSIQEYISDFKEKRELIGQKVEILV